MPWAVTPQTVPVALGILLPGSQSVTDAERKRRIRLMVIAADRLYAARPASWQARRAAARLRRLARLASGSDINEVRPGRAHNPHHRAGPARRAC